MPVRTARLAVGIYGAAQQNQVVYACPAGRTAIVKDIRIVGRNDPLSLFIFFLRSGPSTLVYLFQGQIGANQVQDAQGFVVLEPGDHLEAYCDVASHIAWWVSGAELEGVAP